MTGVVLRPDPRIAGQEFAKHLDPNLIHFSLDLETMSTHKNAVVASIGVFCMNSPWPNDTKFYHTLDIDSQIRAGRHVSDATMRWWFKQDPKVQQATFPEYGNTNPEAAIMKLGTFIKSHLTKDSKPLVWVKGINFDGAITESLCETLHLPCPVEFRQWAEVRDIERLTGTRVHDFEGAHHALTDAVEQGKYVAAKLGWWTPLI